MLTQQHLAHTRLQLCTRRYAVNAGGAAACGAAEKVGRAPSRWWLGKQPRTLWQCGQQGLPCCDPARWLAGCLRATGAAGGSTAQEVHNKSKPTVIWTILHSLYQPISCMAHKVGHAAYKENEAVLSLMRCVYMLLPGCVRRVPLKNWVDHQETRCGMPARRAQLH